LHFFILLCIIGAMSGRVRVKNRLDHAVSISGVILAPGEEAWIPDGQAVRHAIDVGMVALIEEEKGAEEKQPTPAEEKAETQAQERVESAEDEAKIVPEEPPPQKKKKKKRVKEE